MGKTEALSAGGGGCGLGRRTIGRLGGGGDRDAAAAPREEIQVLVSVPGGRCPGGQARATAVVQGSWGEVPHSKEVLPPVPVHDQVAQR